MSDGSGTIPCFANSRACGEFRADVGRPVHNAYVNITSSDLGAWSRTWSPTNESGYMSVVGSGVVRRGQSGSSGYREIPFNVTASNFATEVGDGFVSYNTCNSERNEVLGRSRNSAQGGSMSTLAWIGSFNDADACDPPPGTEQGCDENGNFVDDGGDPANCPQDSDPYSGDTVGSGIQYSPGDYTNGETVSWATGIGDGGQSVCGGRAQVDYICIDYQNDGGEWVEWGCGYATVC
ncbi:MAG: hypothetical protein ACJ796_07820 [Gemmatimonadaceae bacterium]